MSTFYEEGEAFDYTESEAEQMGSEAVALDKADEWRKAIGEPTNEGIALLLAERDRLAEERRALEQDIRDLRNVARGILIQSGIKERLLREMRTIYGHDPHAQRGLALLAEGEAA